MQKYHTLLAQKNCSKQILLFDPKSPTLVTKLPKLGNRYTILDILMHVNSYITFVNLCDLCDMFKDRLQYTLQYNIMINDSNHKKYFFFANAKHFLAMIWRAKKLTTNIGSYLPDFAIKTCTEAASVHASVHHYDK